MIILRPIYLVDNRKQNRSKNSPIIWDYYTRKDQEKRHKNKKTNKSDNYTSAVYIQTMVDSD